ncbi:MAG: peroxiredoxin family protein [Candidatus Dormibacteraeota bacterium]|nr:peroxiredoxin family protein [Candidatus Dormibacteraeota bacterium]
MASYARSWDRFLEAGLQLAAVVVDEPERNAAMVEKLLLPFPVLSDPEGKVIKAYDVWNPGEGGIARPALFLVARDLQVRRLYVGTDFADRPTDEEVFAAVGEARRA